MKVLLLSIIYLFINLFSHHNSEDFKNKDTQALSINNSKDTLLLKKILATGNYTIIQESASSFYKTIETIVVETEDRKGELTLYKSDSKKTKPSKEYKIKLNKSDVSAIYNLFKTGMDSNLETGDCTTLNTYTLKTKEDEIKFTDYTCEFKLYTDWKIKLDKRSRAN